MVNKNCSAQVPQCDLRNLENLPVYRTLTEAHGLISEIRYYIDKQAFHEALEEIWRVIRNANQTVDEAAPWALRKTDPKAMEDVLYILIEVIRHFAIILQPFMPQACAKILDQLAVTEESREFSCLHDPSNTAPFDSNALKPSTPLPSPYGVFPRLSDNPIAE